MGAVRLLRLSLTAGIVVMLSVMLAASAVASGNVGSKDGGSTTTTQDDDNGYDDDDNGYDGGAGVGKDGGGAGVGKDGGGAGVGKDGGYDDNDDMDDSDIGAGAVANVPTTGAGGLATAASSGLVLFGGMITFFGAVAAAGGLVIRQRS